MDFSDPVRRRPRSHNRGFTLIELMTVVVIISILASLGVPQIVERLRERRAGQAAQDIALLYRNARLRALGQGFPVLVRYTSTVGFQVFEGLPASGPSGACTLQLPSSCTQNAWLSAVTDYRTVNLLTAAANPDLTETVKLSDGSQTAALDLCFSPRGRTFARTNAAAPLLPTTGMVTVAVTRAASGNVRNVSILPNGMARVSN